MSLKNQEQEIRSKLNQIIDKLLHLGENVQSKELEKSNPLLAELNRRDSGIEIWDWPQGVGLYGLHKFLSFEENKDYRAFLENWYASHFAGALPLRNINTTAPLLTMVDFIDENPGYRKLAISWADWLIHDLPKTEEGGFQHVTSGSGDGKSLILNEQQLWVDTLFMAVLFLNRMGQKYDRQDWADESIHQMLIHIKYLCDPHTGLFYHGWTFKERNHFGGIFWCRGDGWFTLVVPEFLEQCGETLAPSIRRYISDTFRAQVRALSALQAPDGLWHTILDDPESYEETSGTAAIAAGILHGIRTGILDNSFLPCAEKAIEGILNQIDADGTVLNVSAGTAIGMNAKHYKNIAIAPMAYGQSLTILALVEALWALQVS